MSADRPKPPEGPPVPPAADGPDRWRLSPTEKAAVFAELREVLADAGPARRDEPPEVAPTPAAKK
jgi:hypothetical protein